MRTAQSLTLFSLAALFNLHDQVGIMTEAMCGVNDCTVVSHGVQTFDRPSQILHYEKIFCKNMVSNIKVECNCCYEISNWSFAT